MGCCLGVNFSLTAYLNKPIVFAAIEYDQKVLHIKNGKASSIIHQKTYCSYVR